MPIRSGVACAVLLLASACAWRCLAETEHLTVKLISDASSVEPARPLWVGLHFDIEQHWHIYWRNPGDSGEPPRVRWNLPTGFRAGDIEWPAPSRLGSGSVIDYGYEAPVLLPVELQAPNSLSPGSSVTLAADVSWLICKDICVPGRASLTLSLPVEATPGLPSASHALFQVAKSRAPKAAPSTWKIEAISEKDQFVLMIYGSGMTTASFFPLEADQIDNAAPQAIAALPGGVQLTLRKSDRLVKTPATLAGVLEGGPGRAYAVSVPVRSQH